MDPPWQRRFAWDKEQNAKLIQSMLMGLPMPEIVLCKANDGRLHVVDGRQRLLTFVSFVAGEFALADAFGRGLRYEALSEPEQRMIRNYNVRTFVIVTNDAKLPASLFRLPNTHRLPDARA